MPENITKILAEAKDPNTEPFHWPGKIATIKLIRELHATPMGINCPLMDAKYAAENPYAALDYLRINNTLEGVYDKQTCLYAIKKHFNDTAPYTLRALMHRAIETNDFNGLALVAKALANHDASFVIA
jgi:hypothetical protein